MTTSDQVVDIRREYGGVCSVRYQSGRGYLLSNRKISTLQILRRRSERKGWTELRQRLPVESELFTPDVEED